MTVTTSTPAVVPFVADLARFGDRPALVEDDRTINYRELDGLARAFAGTLEGERRLVLVAAENDSASVIGYLGALAAGHVVLLTADRDDVVESAVAAYDPDVVVRRGATEVRRPGTAHVLHPDLCLLLSTSGSTGSPRLVRLSAENLQSNAEAIGDYLAIRDSDVAVTTLPLHYCYGLSVLHSHLTRGAAVALTTLSVVDACFWDLVRRHRVSALAGVPYTFDLLDRIGFAGMDLPSLRYLTQAGGRLAPERVREYAELGRRRGFDLYVMYGQTEATARMAYLPPDLAVERPGAIGVPVPGGQLRLEPLAEDLDRAELVYAGPNVMLGYAEGPADLALGRTVTELRTGDLARRTEDGLFEIVGRRARFAKVYGLRIDLERVEAGLAEKGYTALATAVDDRLVVAVRGGLDTPLAPSSLAATRPTKSRRSSAFRWSSASRRPSSERQRASSRPPHPEADAPSRWASAFRWSSSERQRASSRPPHPEADGDRAQHAAATVRELTGLPPSAVAVVPVDELPRLPSGKPDLQAVARLAEQQSTPDRSLDVADTFALVLGTDRVRADDSFVSLGGDSLSYVEMSVRLEQVLGHLPERWHERTVAELQASARGGRRRTRAVETNVVLRALAILAIVGTHGNLFVLTGGAHLLLALIGFNVARFQLTDRARPERTRQLVRVAARIAVPALLWIGSVAVLTGMYPWPTALLVNGIAGPESWSEPEWHYWFIEALLVSVLAIAVLTTIPALDRLERRWPFWLPVGLALVALLTRYEVFEPVDGDNVHRAHFVFWLVALGWAAARAKTAWHRIVISVLSVVTVPGLFEDGAREAFVVAGFLALVWVPRLRVPAPLTPVLSTVAGASLWVYLTHWQVYPHLEDDYPLLAVLASFAVGIAAWRVYEALVPRLVRAAASVRSVRLPSVRRPVRPAQPLLVDGP